MLSPDYFGFRWSWYRPILSRGESPEGRCRVDVRRLPIRMAGEDARDYIPYAVESRLLQVFSNSIHRLHDYSVRYMIKGEKISPHQLPQMDAVGRTMAKHLRKRYPHLPASLLHHWCGDPHGAPALYQAWQGMWRQSWRQEQADVAPWVSAVNVLMLKLIRQAISTLPDEHAAHNDHVMVCAVGGLYDWAVQTFLKQHVDGAVEVTKISTYEAMMIPATPIAFLYRQPDDSLLVEDRFVVLAYGLEADLIPRMRVLREKVGPKNEQGILQLLAREKMGEHFLKRSWVRLALWDMAEKTGQGAWMQWVLDAKSLDKLLGRPETLPAALAGQLGSINHPAAEWLRHSVAGNSKKAGTPWLFDDRVLMAFRVFEEDVKVEVARRKAEQLWSDRRAALSRGGRGAEADKALEAEYNEGRLIYFRTDSDQSLHAGVSIAAKQGCLRVEWSDYLASMISIRGDNQFLEKSFLPEVLQLLTGRSELFLDSCSASGCLLRGSIAVLFTAGMDLRERLRGWYRESVEDADSHMPAVSMCLALMGDWNFARVERKGVGTFNVAFSHAVAQADSGVSRDCGTGRLIAYRDKRAGLKPLGGVRVEAVETGTGQTVQLLYNNGYALTAPAIAELTAALRHRAKIREFRVERKAAQAVLGDYRLTTEILQLVCVRPHGTDEQVLVLARVGKPALAGVDIDMFELLDPQSEATRLIVDEGLDRWS